MVRGNSVQLMKLQGEAGGTASGASVKAVGSGQKASAAAGLTAVTLTGVHQKPSCLLLSNMHTCIDA